MKNIFIIDDDIHIGNMLEEVLAREGYGISRAYSGTEALLALSSAKPANLSFIQPRRHVGKMLSIAKTLVEQMDGAISASYRHHRLSICINFPSGIELE